jgi:hypothetical protein
MMTGDVSGAFRHIPINCCFCGHFSGYILIFVNLFLPLRWTGSPVANSIAGQAIKAIDSSEPGFHNLVYSDVHIKIGYFGRFETLVLDISLRRAVMMVLWTMVACNQDKFTRWSRWCIFDFVTIKVSMPAHNIAKIVGRLLALQDSSKVSVLQMRETMGLLRYLGTRIPVARPLKNRLQAFLGVLGKETRLLILHKAQAEDILWPMALFQSDALHNMSMARLTGAVSPHEIINMDGSDLGVCGVWHTQRSYFTVRWNRRTRKN